MTTHNQFTPATARQSLLRRGHKYVTLAFRRKRDEKHEEKAGDVRVMTPVARRQIHQGSH